MSKQRLSIAVISIALALCGCTKTPPEAKLVGEWQGVSGQKGSVVFNRDHSFRGMLNDFVLDQRTLGAIVRFVTDQKIIVRTSPYGQPRPTNFATTSDAKNQWVLVKAR